ncbi:transglycosylase SLT domain-containing protein [Rahnella sp. PD4]|uniref:transglycosylase SLT domain-containing protein n=1 Tax=Rahnella sp. PD4 TaxID=3368611 RepID=UPI003B9EA046
MNAETLKDFLISLGFDVDDVGARKFENVVAGVTANVLKLGTVVEAAAGTVLKIAAGLDDLYWASQRTGASVAGIRALGYAASQTGSNAEAARGSLESLARFMRNNPGAEGFLNRLGVQTRDASGNMRDMSAVFTGVGQQLSKMSYPRANQYAQMLGIDENTLMAMRRGISEYMGQYNAMKSAIGFNPDQAAAASNRFMTSLRSLGEMAGMARDQIDSNLADGLAGSIDNLRKQILDNFPKIEDAITRGVKGLLWLADTIGRVAYRLIQAAGDIWEWWNKLDKGTQQLIEIFGALVFAWKLLNSAFLTSPIGIITALAGGILLLYDDYKTWKEGGKSLIDWAKWEPDIEKAIAAIKTIISWLGEGVKAVGGWNNVLKGLATYVAGAWAVKMLSGILRVSKGFGPILAAMAAINAWNKVGSVEDEAKKRGVSVGQYLIDRQKEKTPFSLSSWIQEVTGLDFSLHAGNEGLFPSRGMASGKPRPTKEGAALLGWLSPTLDKLEALYHLPDGLLKSVAITESAGNPNAVSGAGAQGLFQLMPGTARDLGLRGNEAFDPIKSAQAAAKYLAQLLKANGGDLDKTLASYNWGIGNVQKYGMGLMPQQTREYVPKVLSNMPGHTTHKLEQNNTYYIYGGDPKEIGREVGQRQVSANAQVMRTNQNGRG